MASVVQGTLGGNLLKIKSSILATSPGVRIATASDIESKQIYSEGMHFEAKSFIDDISDSTDKIPTK